jgi:hypothetical protein
MLVIATFAGWTIRDGVAQELEPRAYANTPAGLNFLIAGYSYSEGGVLADAALPLEDGELEIHAATLAFARALAVGGRSAKVDFVVPYARASGSARFAGERRSREVTGLGDPRLRFTMNLLGGPAWTLREFATHRPSTTLGASLQVYIPVGQYDDDKLINIGANRWAMKAEIGLSHPAGALRMEVAGGVTYFEDNDDFLGGQTRAQEEIYSVQTHLIYQLSGGKWTALSATFLTGGRTEVDGVKNDDLQESTRFGVAFALPLGQRQSIKLFASTGVATRIGSDMDTAGVAWQYRWGGGL